MKNKKLMLERPEIDFSSQLSTHKTFDNNISVFNKLKQIILSSLPFNGGFFQLDMNLHVLIITVNRIKLGNIPIELMNYIKNKDKLKIISIADVVIVKNLIPYIMNYLKKIDDTEYNGSIFKYIKPLIKNFSIENAITTSNFGETNVGIYVHNGVAMAYANLVLDIAVNPNDKFIKYVDTGQELIDLGLSTKIKIAEEKRQILKNAGLLRLNI